MTKIAVLGSRKWTTQDGRQLRWREMEPSHLRNCAAMIRRSCVDDLTALAYMAAFHHGDAAQDAIAQEMDVVSYGAGSKEQYARDMERFANHLEFMKGVRK